jgi:NAD+ synthase (glutamine-hydrolysing)
MRTIRIALAQINTTVGDFDGNLRRIREEISRAEALGAELVAFPEQTLPGYPAEDLLLKSEFIEANRRALEQLAKDVRKSIVVVGFADRRDDVYNAAAVIAQGEVRGVYHKHHLPNYSVFDEKRYFQAGREPMVFGYGPITFGVNVCEDMWIPDGPAVLQAAEGGAELLVTLSSSPFHRGKSKTRERMLATRAADNVAAVAFVNQVGGQDELVFDGSSVILNESGEIVARAAAFEEDLIVADLDLESVFRARLHDPRRREGLAPAAQSATTGIGAAALHGAFLPVRRIELPYEKKAPARRRPRITPGIAPALDAHAELYEGLTLGLGDYVKKNRFGSLVLGLSGGIDSALAATLAVDALGPERVIGVSMPSEVTSERSQTDAQDLADNLGIRMLTIPIAPVMEAYDAMLAPAFKGRAPDVTEENLQARIRGNTLMALSNKFGWLVLATSNKSEVSVGYCTLYGDTAGGFAVLKDVPKTMVYALSRWRNERAVRAGETPPIPTSTLTRPPTAELRPGQRDEDSLPPYAVLDPILEAYVEEDQSPEDIAATGVLPDLVEAVTRMVDGNEYKRRQSPPGIKLTPRAFGRDRRLPISHGYRRGRPGDRAGERTADRANERANDRPNDRASASTGDRPNPVQRGKMHGSAGQIARPRQARGGRGRS